MTNRGAFGPFTGRDLSDLRETITALRDLAGQTAANGDPTTAEIHESRASRLAMHADRVDEMLRLARTEGRITYIGASDGSARVYYATLQCVGGPYAGKSIELPREGLVAWVWTVDGKTLSQAEPLNEPPSFEGKPPRGYYAPDGDARFAVWQERYCEPTRGSVRPRWSM